MALYKDIQQDDGIVTSYHRILYVTTNVNSHNSIAVASYIDEEFREEEKEKVIEQPYVKAVTYETKYNPEMTIEQAYDFLKTLDEFTGSTNC